MRTTVVGLAMVGTLAMGGAALGESAELAVKWEVGKAYTYEMGVEMNMELPGQAGGQKTMVEQTVRTEVREGAEAGHRRLSIEYVRMLVEMAMMGQVMKFDSEDPGAASPMLEGMFQPMLEAEMAVTLDAEDNVVDVEGFGGDQAPGMPTEEQIRDMVTGAGDALPEGAVEVGTSWTDEREMAMGEAGNVKVTTEYTFEAIEEKDGRRLARLAFEGSMDIGGEDAQVQISEGKLRDGVMLLDLDAAVMESSSLTIEMTMAVAGQELPMAQKVTQTLISVEDL